MIYLLDLHVNGYETVDETISEQDGNFSQNYIHVVRSKHYSTDVSLNMHFYRESSLGPRTLRS